LRCSNSSGTAPPRRSSSSSPRTRTWRRGPASKRSPARSASSSRPRTQRSRRTTLSSRHRRDASVVARRVGSLPAVLARLATIDDAEATRAIYNIEVSESTVTFDLVPRTLEEQRVWLTARSGAHAVLVAEDGGEVVGFASVSPYRDRPAYSTSVEDSVYVRRDQQGKGVGKLLLSE